MSQVCTCLFTTNGGWWPAATTNWCPMKPARILSGKRLTVGRVRAPHLQAVRIRKELAPRPLMKRSCVYKLMSTFCRWTESDWNKNRTGKIDQNSKYFSIFLFYYFFVKIFSYLIELEW